MNEGNIDCKKKSPNTDNRFLLVSFATIFLLGFCLRLYGINRDLGDGDENAMLIYFGLSSFKFIATNYFDTNNHIFHTLTVRLMSLIFGEDNEAAIRLPSFIFGLAGLYVLYDLAKKLFDAKIALISLLISTLSPVHILYSQTARGYSLIIFFSLTMVYSTLKIFEKKSISRWGTVLILSGFLSIYTIPTNVYFVFSLFIWTIYVLIFSRRPIRHLDDNVTNKKNSVTVICCIYFLMALISFLAYWNLIDQIPQAINSNESVQSQAKNILGWKVILLTPKILSLCFQGPQIWFLPFIIFGIISVNSKRKQLKYFPLFIFFLPFLLNIIIGFAGFPRNYLFNLPFLIVFLAVGLVFFSNYFSKFLPSFLNSNHILIFLLIVYVLFTLKWLLVNYYPMLRIQNEGTLLKNSISKKNIETNDLIIIQNPNQYLYARSLYKKNLKNIIFQNQLDGVKMITPKNYSLNNFQVKTEAKLWKIFNGQIIEKQLKRISLSKEKDLIFMTHGKPFSVSMPEIQNPTNWRVVSGKGQVSNMKTQNNLKNNALLLKASLNDSLILRTSTTINLNIKQTGLLVLVWTMKRSNSQIPAFYPALTFQLGVGLDKASVKLPLGKINEGINILISENQASYFSDIWSANAIIGKIPAGKYGLHLWLKCYSNNSVLYDNLRLFFVPSHLDLSKRYGSP